MGLTVKDFAKTLKIKDDALLERMKAAGLSHNKASDEITPADKLAILKSLKERKLFSEIDVSKTPSIVHFLSKSLVRFTFVSYRFPQVLYAFSILIQIVFKLIFNSFHKEHTLFSQLNISR